LPLGFARPLALLTGEFGAPRVEPRVGLLMLLGEGCLPQGNLRPGRPQG
jgi:hypothetical protein